MLFMHNNNNYFTKKDVFAIKETLEVMLIQPLLRIFSSFSHQYLSEYCEIKNTLESVIFRCNNMLKPFGTQ